MTPVASGFPIRTSSDHRVLARFPRLFAGSYVLHRLLLPRHPPHALCSLLHRNLALDRRRRDKSLRIDICVYPNPYTHCERTKRSVSRFEMQLEDSDTVLPEVLLTEVNGIGLLKEVIQPQVPLRLPCYDFTPIADLAVDAPLLAVGVTASGTVNSRGVTGGVYKARERIHRGILIRDY